MEFYVIALFLHIIGALGLSAAFAFEWLSMSRLRHVTTRSEAATWVQVRSLVQRIGPLSMILLVVPGLIMTASRWSLIGWPGAALLGMIGIVVIGITLAGRSSALSAAMRDPQGAAVLTPEIIEQLRSPLLGYALAMRSALALGIVGLMVSKPDLASSLLVLAVSIALGFGLSWTLTRTTARAAPSSL